MTPRINLADPNEGIEAMRSADHWVQSNLDPKLVALVKVRASQINGCTFLPAYAQHRSVQARRKPDSAAAAGWLAGVGSVLGSRKGGAGLDRELDTRR